ncbi:MAG: hypothetical protein CMI58_06380 [Parcubacteria group bacterium]|nr:hypothetical protein [Parcubacteria group bacterium]
MDNEKTLNIYDIIAITIKNYKYAIFFTLFISILPSYFIYKNYSNDDAIITLVFETPPEARFELNSINDKIFQLNDNQLFKKFYDRLQIFYSSYVLSEKLGKIQLTPLLTKTKIFFLDDLFYKNALKRSDYISDNSYEISHQMDINKENSYYFTFKLSKTIKDHESESIINDKELISYEINKLIREEVSIFINLAAKRYASLKSYLIRNINKSNNLIIESYIFDLNTQIQKVKEQADIVRAVSEINAEVDALGSIQSVIASKPIDTSEPYLMNLYDTSEPYFSQIDPASRYIALQKQISILEEQIINPNQNLPQIFSNNQILSILEDDYLILQIMNKDLISVSELNLFILSDITISYFGISLELMLIYISITILFSCIFSIFIVLMIDQYKTHQIRI